MALALTVQKTISLLLAKLKYRLFNVRSVIVLNLDLSDNIVVEFPGKEILNIGHYIVDLHKDLTVDAIYILASNDGILYKLLATIKNTEEQEIFTERLITGNQKNVPKYLMALHPFKKTFFHKHIIVVGS